MTAALDPAVAIAVDVTFATDRPGTDAQDSGEHGLGITKRGALAGQWPPAALALHDSLKRLLDPKGLLNPGKKLASAD